MWKKDFMGSDGETNRCSGILLYWFGLATFCYKLRHYLQTNWIHLLWALFYKRKAVLTHHDIFQMNLYLLITVSVYCDDLMYYMYHINNIKH